VEDRPDDTISETGEPVGDQTYSKQEGVDVIYLAGGCFWGLEKLMQTLPGVTVATSGYANGQGEDPTYSSVSNGNTGYRETVRVEYEPDKVSLDRVLFTFFTAIDPTVEDKQGNDVGTQYQSGIYYTNDTAKETVDRIADVERGRYEPFAVEITALSSFYDAEDYHQDYLDKNPNGYCHITSQDFDLAAKSIVDPGDYPRPSDDAIKASLTEVQYNVTQKEGTEPAFDNEYWDTYEQGIYADVVTGEPLFSSQDKFDAGTGWPSFTQGIDENTLILLDDTSLGMVRTAVQSRAGNSHLGHVFYGENESSTGARFCINSASLRFIPVSEMETQGYGYLKDYVI
jgi:peptide methionine sulfoxide reductase msrA/msrB